MHITLETDYAIRIVYILSKSDIRMDAKSIAASTNVTIRFSLKILRKLVGSKIIKSFKGTLGGYELNKPCRDITLLDIITTIEGPITFSRCSQANYVCEHMVKNGCSFHRIFRNISSDVQSKLQEITIQSILDAENK